MRVVLLSDQMDNTNLQKCRTCFAQGRQLTPLSALSESSNKIHISEMFMYCASIQISLNDGCSQLACSECVKSAEIAYRFKKQCEYSDKIWNEFRRRLKMEPVEPDFHEERNGCEIDGGTKHTALESVSPNLQEETLEVLANTQIPFDDESEGDDYQIGDDSEMAETQSVEFHKESDDPDIKPIEIHEEVKTESFICKFCFEIFVDEAKLSRHERAHTIEPKRSAVKEYAIYGCRGCSVDCKTAEDFIEHCQKLHKNSIEELYYRCKLCAGDFADLYRLTVHVSKKNHQNLKPAGQKRKLKSPATWPQSCRYCSLLLKSVSDKMAHINQDHSDLKKFSCNKCEKTFVTNYGCNKHKEKHKQRTCHHCGESFSCASNLMKHIEIHHNEMPYKCDDCDETFTNSATLQSHQSIHVSKEMRSKKPFECRVCHKRFKTRDSLRPHMRRHPGNLKLELPPSVTWPQHQNLKPAGQKPTLKSPAIWPQSCRYCSLLLKSVNEKMAHINQDHSDLKKFSCNKCEKTFVTNYGCNKHKEKHKQRTCHHCGESFSCASKLMKHIKIHHNEEPYKCDHCDETFTNSATLQSHQSIHVSKEMRSKKPFECRVCHKRFKTRDSLRPHMRRHPGNLKLELPPSVTWPQQCKYCPLTLNYLREKIAHLDQEHSEFKNVSCDKCGKAFFTKVQLRQHVVIHEPVKRHMCQYCGSSFAAASNLNQHIRIHTGEKRFKCDKCDARFAHWATLYTHQSLHTDERKFECNECNKKFKSAPGLRRHTLIHSDKRYPCHLCSRQLKSRKTLRAHILTHSNERSCLCKICGKGFNRRFTLKQHMQTHTGEKPHVCTICNKGFSQAHCLRSHNASFHKVDKM